LFIKTSLRDTHQFTSTGATGYIGGDVFYAVSQAHPDWEISVLVRSKEKGAKLAGEYPKVRIVYGDLDSGDIIEAETKIADIVFRAYTSHLKQPALSKGYALLTSP
jgi:uncharacterized protein YbjT (DUF2867 family)